MCLVEVVVVLIGWMDGGGDEGVCWKGSREVVG